MTQYLQIDNDTFAMATDTSVEVWRADVEGLSPIIFCHGSPGNWTIIGATREQAYSRPSTALVEQMLQEIR